MKQTMNLALLAVAAPVLVAPAPRPADAIAFAPEKGATLTKTFERTLELSLEDMTSVFIINGEEHPSGGGDISTTRGEVWRVVLADQYHETKDGSPLRLSRTFEEIALQTAREFSSDSDSNFTEGEAGSDLEGQTVVFTWDEDDGEYAVAFAEGEDGDEELLAGLVEEADLRGFLPTEEVAEGDEWEIEATEPMSRLLFPGGDLSLAADSESGSATSSEDALWRALQGELTATYAGTREVDGVEVAVIELAGDLEAEAEDTRSVEGSEMETRLSAEVALEGELLWSIEHGRVFGLTLDGDLSTTLETVNSHSGGEFEFEMRSTQSFRGELHVALTTD